MSSAAPFARQCCPVSALRLLSPADVRALDAYCRRAMADPDAEPRAGVGEIAGVARYEQLLLASGARFYAGRRRGCRRGTG